MKNYKEANHVDILLVEDNLADIRLTQEVFKDARIRNTINIVTDGEDAMKYLKKKGKFSGAKAPDIVLLDLNLPKKGGKEVLAEIKSDEVLKIIPVIILTTSSDERDILSSYYSYANCYITKPIDLSQFVKVVQAVEEFWLSMVQLPKIELLPNA